MKTCQAYGGWAVVNKKESISYIKKLDGSPMGWRSPISHPPPPWLRLCLPQHSQRCAYASRGKNWLVILGQAASPARSFLSLCLPQRPMGIPYLNKHDTSILSNRSSRLRLKTLTSYKLSTLFVTLLVILRRPSKDFVMKLHVTVELTCWKKPETTQ